MKKLLSYKAYYADLGILILRIGIGWMFVLHGWPKIIGGSEKWAKLGGAMKHIGITFAPEFWGFMGAFAEFGGGILLMIGLFTRLSAGMMAFTMFIAATLHLATGDGVSGASHAIEALFVFVLLLFIGPGKYSLDKQLS